MKGAPPRKHLIKNCAERKDVRTMIHRVTFDLFRRHVSDCAHYYTRISIDTASWYISLRLAAVGLRQLGYSEVENLNAAIFGDEDVVGLQIAMNNSLFVSGGQAVRNLTSVVGHAALGQRGAAHSLTQCLAFQ